MPINYGSNNVTTSGNFVASSGNFTTALTVNNVPVSVSGHTHNYDEITNLSIDNLNDVDTDGLSDGEFLVYNTGVANWLPSTNLTYLDNILNINCDSPTNEAGYGIVGDGNIANFRANQFYEGSIEPPRIIFRRARGTQASPVIPNSGDGIFAIRGETIDYNGDVAVLGGVRMEVTEPSTSSGTYPGTKIFLRVTSGGNSLLYKTLTLNSDGSLFNQGSIQGQALIIDNITIDNNTIRSTDTNGDIIIESNGTGALQRDSDGNNRGIRAVDLQNQRSASNQVAGGNYSTIGGGTYNSALGYAGTVGGGTTNYASSQGGTVAGGSNNSAGLNTATIGCTVGGGDTNLCFGNYSTIGGGYDNGTDAVGAVVCGGSTNRATAPYSTVLGGFRGKATRYGEVAHAAGRFASDGDAQHITLVARGLTISGAFTVNISTPSSATFTRAGHSLSVGDTVKFSTTGSLPTGLNTTTTYYVISDGLTSSTFKVSTTKNGSGVITSGSQSGTHTLIPSTSLTLNGVTGTTTPSLMVIPARSTWSFAINLSAYSSQNNQGGAWWVVGGLRRNVSTTIELGSSTGLTFLENAFSADLISVDADADNSALDIRVTGIANQSIRWVAMIDIAQVSFGTP